MNISSLHAISPIDGRYIKQTADLSKYYSEYALIEYRIRVEILYFLALCKIPLPQLEDIEATNLEKLGKLSESITPEMVVRVKEIEVVTNHDVKAVEYFLREEFVTLGLGNYIEFIHFGLTSQDVNNTALPMMVKDSMEILLIPAIDKLADALTAKAIEWKNIPMLARTHGQPASPTMLGKEFMVFVERLNNQLDMLKNLPYAGKFGGATGNFNAHHIAYPEIDWLKFANTFLSESLGLQRLQITTQIEHYDYLAALFHNLSRINTIIIDFNRDIWTYISMEYFKQKIKEGEVGSSAMPHKVNPIDFENSEGNLGMANAIFNHLSSSLPISRLQRDLTDSTVSRNIGIPMAYTLIGLKSCMRGIDKLLVNQHEIDADLEKNQAVLAEAIQTILRREKYPDPYNTLKKLTRNNEKITKDKLITFIAELDLNDKVKKELSELSVRNYTGIELF